MIFAAGTRLRNGLYATGALKPVRVPRPVLSVGNITLGGTGKTPLVVYLAQWLADRGFTPALLTRGYGRQARSRMIIVSPGDVAPLPASCGDEPALIRRLVPQTWLGVCSQRHLAAAEILKRCDEPIFLLDDGYQHRSLHRDLNLVVIDPSQPLLRNRVVPLGTLREPLSSLERADAVVINGDVPDMQVQVRGLASGTCVFCCVQSIESLVPLRDWLCMGREASSAEVPTSVFLVAALGNPKRFQADAERFGLRVRGTRFFKDHYHPRAAEWQACDAGARAAGAAALLVTAKDAIKMTYVPEFPCFVAVQSTRILEQRAFDSMLEQVLRKHR
jgi:tetraacyldisaccharide 4'-kinase